MLCYFQVYRKVIYIYFIYEILLKKFLAIPSSMWDLISPTRDGTCTSCIRRWSLNHWTTGKSL